MASPLQPADYNDPLVRQFIQTVEDRDINRSEMMKRAGLSRAALRWWRTSSPSLVNFTAALNAIGLELCIRPMQRREDGSCK